MSAVRQPSSEEQFDADQLARFADDLGFRVADIVGTIHDVTQVSATQLRLFGDLDTEVNAMVAANQQIHATAEHAAKISAQAKQTTRTALDAAIARVEERMDALAGRLKLVADASTEINQISLQTRLVAFNASVEAVRAGEAGRSFAVVAEAIKDLAEKVQRSSKAIGTTLAELQQELATLVQRDETASGYERSLHATVDAAADAVNDGLGAVAAGVEQTLRATRENMASCARATTAVRGVKTEIDALARATKTASAGTEQLLSISEALHDIAESSGIETADSAYVDTARDTARAISAAFERALAAGQLSQADLFDQNYQPIPNTNPQQHLSRFAALADTVLPQIIEPVRAMRGVVFTVAADRNGYVPTHNREYNKPQGSDPVWNAANCRNRRIFTDRAGATAGRNTKPFLIQTYRRDMGGGKFVVMKEVNTPIVVNGRHWGNVRLAYRRT